MAKPVIKFPCMVRLTIHTYAGTQRTAVESINNQAELDAVIASYMSDTTGQTKSVTHAVYHRPNQ